MAGIFVSYRRDDSQGFAGRLADDLAELLGADRVFRDVEIPAGSDFTDVLHQAIATSDALVVVIGRHWAATSEYGQGARLFEPTDWVRTEIEAAFAQGKEVIPVLVGGAQMPAPDALPRSIARLARLQAAELNDRGWDDAVDDLADRLRALCPSLAADDPDERRDQESPATVLRELGERFLDEVASRRRPQIAPPSLPPTFLQRLWRGVGQGVTRLMWLVIILTLAYAGMRLFGDENLLRTLDTFEGRLLTAWQRLLGYLPQL